MRPLSSGRVGDQENDVAGRAREELKRFSRKK